LHPLLELGNISKSWSFLFPGKQNRSDVKGVCFHSWVCSRDIMADANILQGHIFHDDVAEDECIEASEPIQSEPLKNNGEGLRNPKQLRQKPKPAAHRVCLWHVEVDFFSFVFSVHCDFLQECVLIL